MQPTQDERLSSFVWLHSKSATLAYLKPLISGKFRNTTNFSHEAVNHSLVVPLGPDMQAYAEPTVDESTS